MYIKYMCEYRNKYFGRRKSLLSEIISLKKKVHHADFAFYLQLQKLPAMASNL